MKQISWDVSRFEHELIVKIVERWEADGDDDRREDRAAKIMDITACHANGMQLDLSRMLEAPKFDFLHDVYGIRRHINRETGEIEGCFVPRMALANHVVSRA